MNAIFSPSFTQPIGSNNFGPSKPLVHWLIFIKVQSEADSHWCAETAKQADGGGGHPSQDEHDKGEHVGGLVAEVANVILDLGPDAKHPHASGDDPTESEEGDQTQCAATSHLWSFHVLLLEDPCPKRADVAQQSKNSIDLKKKKTACMIYPSRFYDATDVPSGSDGTRHEISHHALIEMCWGKPAFCSSPSCTKWANPNAFQLADVEIFLAKYHVIIRALLYVRSSERHPFSLFRL